jgi:hypothetical protein
VGTLTNICRRARIIRVEVDANFCARLIRTGQVFKNGPPIQDLKD